MIFYEINLILCFLQAIVAIALSEEDGLQTSSKYDSNNISKISSPSHCKDTPNENDFMENHLKQSPESWVARSFKNISSHDLNEAQAEFGRYVSETLTYTLNDENILLLYDIEILNLYDWIEFLLYRSLKDKPHIAIALQEFDINNYDTEIVSGYQFTTLCFIYNQNVLLDFFSTKTKSHKWAPAKLFMVFLDHQANISEVIFDSSIQRSEYIFIAQLKIKMNKFMFLMYSVFPSKRKKDNLSTWKSHRRVYTFPKKRNKISWKELKILKEGYCTLPPYVKILHCFIWTVVVNVLG